MLFACKLVWSKWPWLLSSFKTCPCISFALEHNLDVEMSEKDVEVLDKVWGDSVIYFTPVLIIFCNCWQTLDMLVIVLQQCRKESEERWKRLSRQITDAVIPALAKLQVRVTTNYNTIVLQQCRKESEERWKRLSRQITDAVIPALAKLQVSVTTNYKSVTAV